MLAVDTNIYDIETNQKLECLADKLFPEDVVLLREETKAKENYRVFHNNDIGK